MINIAVCDDEQIILDIVARYISPVENICTDYYTSGEDLLNTVFTNGKKYDIYILDIYIDKINGMEIAKKIRNQDCKAVIMFLTNCDSYVFDAFELNIFRYIQKLFMEEKLLPAINDAIERVNYNKPKHYLYSRKKVIEKIDYKDITHISKYMRDVEIHLKDGTTRTERKNLVSILKDLNSDEFVLADKGIIVNINNIDRIEDTKIYLTNNKCIYASRAKIRELNAKITNFWRAHL